MRVVIVVSAIGDGPKEVSTTRAEDEAGMETNLPTWSNHIVPIPEIVNSVPLAV